MISMYNILTMNKIAACGTDKFDKAAYTITDECAEPTAIMVRSAKLHDYEMPSTSALSRALLYSTLPVLTLTLLRSWSSALCCFPPEGSQRLLHGLTP